MNAQSNTPVSFIRITAAQLTSRAHRMSVPEDEVHVWGIGLESDGEVRQIFWQLLAGDERERAGRLAASQHRDERIVAYGALRLIASRYEGCDPGDVRIERAPLGKPFLRRRDGGGDPVRFNLTHSHGRVLVAVARGREVGIDLERIDPDRDVKALAKRFLDADEQRMVECAPQATKPDIFTRLWVAREAACKAAGTGLALPLDRSRIELSDDQQAARLVSRDAGLTVDYAIRFLPVEAGWIAAVAAQGSDWRINVCGEM